MTDRRTDGRTEFSSLDRVCIACIAVKNRKRSCFFKYEKKTKIRIFEHWPPVEHFQLETVWLIGGSATTLRGRFRTKVVTAVTVYANPLYGNACSSSALWSHRQISRYVTMSSFSKSSLHTNACRHFWKTEYRLSPTANRGLVAPSGEYR